MPRTVFAPRRVVAAPPPPDGLTAQQPAGTVTLAVPREATQALHLAGGSLALRGTPPLVPQQQAGTQMVASESEPPRPFPGSAIVIMSSGPPGPQQLQGRIAFAASEEPRPGTLDGRFATAPWGLVQPVVRPTASVVAASEEPRPEAGHTLRGYARPPFDNTPPVPARLAAAEPRPPEPGRFAVSPVGFGVPRRPVRALVISPEVRAPAPGATLTGEPPPPNLTPQQPAGEVVVACREEPPPEAGRLFARAFGRVRSERYALRPVVAQSEPPRPEPGRATVLRAVLGNPPPNRPFSALVRIEERVPEAGRALASHLWLELPPPVKARICAAEAPPPFAGAWLAEAGQPVSLPVQQQPGRVLLASVEAPRPEEGRTISVTGADAGATPPDIG